MITGEDKQKLEEALGEFRRSKKYLLEFQKRLINECRKCVSHREQPKKGHKCDCEVQEMQDKIIEVF